MVLRLISFVLCPFAQRVVITLKEKGVDFSLEHIDLAVPPDWFAQLSPLGKVPLLEVDETLLFESSVIIDYLDQVHAPKMQPEGPLERAQHKAWIEYGSGLLLDQASVLHAKDETDYQKKLEAFQQSLSRLSDPVAERLFGQSERFLLIDVAYAPLFMRIALMAEWRPEWRELVPPLLQPWQRRLLDRPSVAQSVVGDFALRYREFFLAKGSWVMGQIKA
ncbi:glutathione S-transferase family protein [Candidatus Endoriftia persephone]|nr:glutathione S-transferase family protein [Candidatus Endoriftia persephone]USF86732.1 glutathione S-transferase family protein [Candidatus Endoriftia persephone]